MRIAKAPALFATLIWLAACQTTTSPVIQVDPSAGPGEAPVPVDRALSLLDATCGVSLPNFAQLDKHLKSSGFVRRASTGTVYSDRENASVKLINGPGLGKSCSFVFASSQPKKQAFGAFGKAFEPVVKSPLGLTGAYQRNGHTTLVLISEPSRSEGLNYFNLRVLSER